MSIGELDGGTTESHGETRQQRLHLQLRSGKLHNGKRVEAHGIPHHLRNGVISFLGRNSRKSTRSVDRTPTHNTFGVVQFVHKRGTHTQRAWLKNGIVIFVRMERV